MLNIPQSFWESETRLDFEVPAAMKKAWALQLTMLDRTLEIAKKHNIKIWLDYGSLLGCVRHKGYVPWDDDIDVCVLREDYMKLIFILRDELPEYCHVFSFYTDERCDQPKGFVTNRKVIDVGISPEEARLTAMYFGCPYMTGIDLYPLDYAPEDPELWDSIKTLYSACYSLAMETDRYKESGELEDYLTQLEDLVGQKIKRDEHLRNSLWKLADSVAMITLPSESNHVLWYPDSTFRTNEMRRDIAWYKNTIIMPFEFMEVPIPAGYDGVLSTCYSANYMTPRRANSTHGYPFYAEQEKIIQKYKKE